MEQLTYNGIYSLSSPSFFPNQIYSISCKWARTSAYGDRVFQGSLSTIGPCKVQEFLFEMQGMGVSEESKPLKTAETREAMPGGGEKQEKNKPGKQIFLIKMVRVDCYGA